MIRLSLAIPAYNEGERLPLLLTGLVNVAHGSRQVRYELIVSDDGSRPESAAQEEAAVQRADAGLRDAGLPHRVRFVRAEQNRGKGASIRNAWAQADSEADWLGFVDADGSYRPEEINRLAQMLATIDADVLAASRIKMAGKHIERRLFRHLQSRVFATVVEETLGLGFYDTQAGMKFFRASVLRPILPLLEEERWMLDLELLAHVKRAGGKFREEPVDCYYQPDSNLRFGLDALKMFWTVQQIRRRVERAGA